MDAAPRSFVQALDSVGHAPAQVTTAGHDADPRAIRETLGPEVAQRTSRDKNKRIARDHRGVKQRDHPMRGFGCFMAAARCCPAFAEQRQYFRAVRHRGEHGALTERRRRFHARRIAVMAALAAA